jgi:hypothetical protein
MTHQIKYEKPPLLKITLTQTELSSSLAVRRAIVRTALVAYDLGHEDSETEST